MSLTDRYKNVSDQREAFKKNNVPLLHVGWPK